MVIVVAEKVAAGKSEELTARAKGRFKVTAILPNDRYEVQDLRYLKKSPNQRSTVSVVSLSKYRRSPSTQWSRLVGWVELGKSSCQSDSEVLRCVPLLRVIPRRSFWRGWDHWPSLECSGMVYG